MLQEWNEMVNAIGKYETQLRQAKGECYYIATPEEISESSELSFDSKLVLLQTTKWKLVEVVEKLVEVVEKLIEVVEKLV